MGFFAEKTVDLKPKDLYNNAIKIFYGELKWTNMDFT